MDSSAVIDISKEISTDQNAVTGFAKTPKDDSSLSDIQYQPDGSVRVKVLRGHTDAVSSGKLFDHDHKILSASHDGNVILWGFHENVPIHVYESANEGGKVCMAKPSPDGTKFISVGWDRKIHLWDLETGLEIWTGLNHSITMCCSFSSEGQKVITGDDLDANVRIWDVRSGDVIRELRDLHASTVTSVLFSSTDDRVVSTSMDMTTKLYDLKTNCNTVTLHGHKNIISDASFTFDQRKLATVSWDKSIRVWDVTTGMFRSQGATAIEKAHEGSISACDFTSDGSALVTGGYDNQICIWDTENMIQKFRLQGHHDWVEDVCLSEDNNWIVSASKDKTLRLWNIENTDSIPMVMENRKAIGIKVATCTSCGKPFSIGDEISEHHKECVFCRLGTVDSTAIER
ncbi:hypothetical protein CAPTEDRAFT_168582 [Capitella teleta]|uniref:Uncharacterized protein n=1 Tax=Capitella teleta TaxID=283909 RepID=R7T8K6_CAPTE|nr:hypothetical protein CAPTEDRAFT_168582 [Capitella teleta]|eukprot:ELT87334.1 hypothetical protein CAPTEDRAFT_168582 [Capitella teleta]